MPENPCPHPDKTKLSRSLRAIHADVLKEMVSYRSVYECVHRRASDRQHVRKALFTESLWACQALNCRKSAKPPAPHPSGVADRVRQWFAGEKRLQIGDHAVLHSGVGFKRMTADMRAQHDIGQRRQRIRGV